LVGKSSLQYCILETEKNQFISLADFHLPKIPKNTEGYISELSALVASEKALDGKYSSMIIGLDTPFHTLVPEPLFDPENPSRYLEFNFNLPEKYEVKFDKIDEMGSVCVYAYHHEYKGFLAKRFAAATKVNPLSGLIRAMGRIYQTAGQPEKFILHVGRDTIHLFFFRESKQPVFYNSFPFKTREDILYYTLYAYEQLKIRPDSVPLDVLGVVESVSETTDLLEQYFRPVTMQAVNSMFSYGELRLPENKYIELLSLSLCAL
jgi:hypothetical protein